MQIGSSRHFYTLISLYSPVTFSYSQTILTNLLPHPVSPPCNFISFKKKNASEFYWAAYRRMGEELFTEAPY